MPLNLPPPKAPASSSQVPDSPSATPATTETRSPSTSNGHAGSSTAGGPVASTSGSAGLSLPPPKTKAKLAAQSQPKKFMLDLPKPSRIHAENDGEDGPAAKKARTDDSSAPATKKTGLGSLLPPPKQPATGIKLPEPKTAGPSASTPALSSTSLLPHALKNKKASAKPEIPAEPVEEAPPAEDPAVLDFFGLASTSSAPPDPAADFFGLGSSSTTAGPSVASTPSTSTSKSKFSAAPTLEAPDLESNYYATLPLPTPGDPYPGFYKKPDGSWAPKRPDEWDVWSKAYYGQPQEAETSKEEPAVPKDFEEVGIHNSVEVRADRLRQQMLEENNKPGKITEEDKKKMEEEKEKAKNSKKFTYTARSRHQLSTLIHDATVNRAELEERIANMKNNKRAGGAKYGF